MIKEMNFSEIPKGWIQVNLGEVIEPSKEKVNPTSLQKVPYIGLEHIEKDTGQLLGFGTSDEVRSTKTRFSKGDMLYGKLRPYLNKVLTAHFEGVCSTDILVFPKSPNISMKFLAHRFLCNDFVRYTSLNVSGVQHPRVDFQTLSRFIISLPPLAEQHRIVAKIEELFSDLDAGVEALKKAKAQLKLYRHAVLKAAFEGRLTAEWRETHKAELKPANELLKQIKKEWKVESQRSKKLTSIKAYDLPIIPDNWVWIQIGEIGWVTKLAGFEYTKHIKYQESVDVRVVRGLNIGFGEFKADNFRYIDKSTSNYLTRSQLHGGEILITYVGTLGTAAILPKDGYKYHLGPNVGKIVLTDIIKNPKFVLYFVLSFWGQDFIKTTSKAVAQSSLSMEQIRSLPVPFAPLAEQEKVIEMIERYFSLADAVDEALNNGLIQSDRLRQSILKKAFAGELVPQDPEDEPAAELLERIKTEKGGHPAGRRSHAGIKRTGKLW